VPRSRSRLGRLAFWRVLMLPGRRGGPSRRARADRSRRFELGRATQPSSDRGFDAGVWVRRLGGIAVVAVLAYLALWAVQGDTFRVRHVAIEGIEVTSPHAIMAAADVDRDLMFTLDGSAAAERIEGLDSVKSVTVSRSWPSTVRIEVVEHQAWGYWQEGGERIAVDRDGNALVASRPAPGDAPTIVEFAAPRDGDAPVTPDADAVQLAARLIDDPRFEERDAAPVAFIFEQDRGLTVHFDEIANVVFGDSAGYDFKLATWAEVHDQIVQRDLVVAEIDLRFGRQVVLR
jgi:hypothetical protein